MMTRRGLLPTVCHDDPDRGKDRTKRHHQSGEKMKARRYAVPSEYQYSEKARFQKEGKDAFSRQSRSKDVPDKARIDRPVRTKLKFHDDACCHPDGKAHRIQRRPKSCCGFIDGLSLPEEHPFEV